jgi:hypothetical protein
MRAVMMALVLMTSTAALAGRGGGGGGRVVVSRGGGGGYGGGRVVVHHAPTVVVRQPVYGAGRVVIDRPRYYDRNMRPPMIVENYGRRPGYYWVQGSHQWDGREWVWYPGHYEADPAYGQVRVYGGGY